MKTTISVILFLTAFGSFGQGSFQLPGDGNWYKVASIGGQHGYIDYIYWHATGNNPSMARGEIEFINYLNYTVQHHQTMGYAAWNQPQFAYLNFGSYSELWVKATNGVSTGTFQINKFVNVTIAGNVSDGNLTDNGGTLITYNKLEDNTNVFVGNTKTYGTSYFGGYPAGTASANSYAMEVGGPSPTNTSGQATMFFHHHGVIAHQLRYTGGSLFLEAAGNGYGTSSTPNFYVGGNVGIGLTAPGAQTKLHVFEPGSSTGTWRGRIVSSGENNAVVMGEFNGKACLGAHNSALNAWSDLIFQFDGGNVGIGTTSPDAKLSVAGQIHAQEVKVSVAVPGPDYVFEKDYQLTSLEEIKNYIDQNKHLPEVPSAADMEKNGVQLGEMNMLLLKKLEELTLYMIEMKKESENQKQEIQKLFVEVEGLRKK